MEVLKLWIGFFLLGIMGILVALVAAKLEEFRLNKNRPLRWVGKSLCPLCVVVGFVLWIPAMTVLLMGFGLGCCIYIAMENAIYYVKSLLPERG